VRIMFNLSVAFQRVNAGTNGTILVYLDESRDRQHSEPTLPQKEKMLLQH